jgi:hypothetical protein
MAVPLLAACDGSDGRTGVTLTCPSKEASEAPADLSALSLEEVYQRMADSMTCPGYALKAVTTEREEIIYPEEGTGSGTMAGNTWLDFSADRARGEAQTEYVASGEDGSVVEERKDSTVSIVLGDVEYRGPTAEDPHRRRGQAYVCSQSDSALLSLLLWCAGGTADSVTRFETDAEYQGRRVPALVTEGSTTGEAGTTVFAQHLYLDVDTLLPLHNVFEGTLNEENSEKVEVTYEYEFVPLDSLAEDFFDPAALPEPDPEADLRGTDIGMTLYWLGRDFPSTGGLPALSLESAKPFPEPGMYEPGYRALLDYRLADDEFGLPAVGLQVYPRAVWDAFLAQPSGGRLGNYWDDPCIQKTEWLLDSRRAVVFGGYKLPSPECPAPTAKDWGAYVYVDDAVVLVDVQPSIVKPGDQHTPNPYNSREGMEAIISGLVPRPPD